MDYIDFEPINELSGSAMEPGGIDRNGYDNQVAHVLRGPEISKPKIEDNFEKNEAPAPNTIDSNESLVNHVETHTPATEGMKWEALPKAEDELTFKIDHRDYIVTVDATGEQKAIPSSNDAKLAQIVEELKANGTYLRYDTVEELGNEKVEGGAEQNAEQVEAGTRFGTLYVLNRADMTIKIYMVKEVRIEPEENLAPLDEDDGDVLPLPTAKPSLFAPRSPEPVVTPAIITTPETAKAAQAEAEIQEIMDLDDEFIPPYTQVIIKNNVKEPTITTTIAPRPEIVDLGIIDKNEANQTDETYQSNASNESYFRTERFIATEQAVTQVAEEPFVITENDFKTFELEDQAVDEEIQVADAEMRTIQATEETPAITLEIVDKNQTNQFAESYESDQSNSSRESYFRVEQFFATQEVIAETAVPETEGSEVPEPAIKAEPEIIKAVEPISIIIETPQAIETPVVNEKVDQEPIEGEDVTSEPIKVESVVLGPIKVVNEKPEAIKIEKVEAVQIAKPEIKVQPKIEARNVEAPKVIKEPAKIDVKPEPIKLEKIDTIKEPIRQELSKPVIETPRIEVKKVETSIQEKTLEASPIQIISNAAEFAKVSPTRSETRINITNDRVQQFRNTSTPIKVSVNQFEGARSTVRQDSVAKIIDEIEKDSYAPNLQKTGISIAR